MGYKSHVHFLCLSLLPCLPCSDSSTLTPSLLTPSSCQTNGTVQSWTMNFQLQAKILFPPQLLLSGVLVNEKLSNTHPVQLSKEYYLCETGAIRGYPEAPFTLSFEPTEFPNKAKPLGYFFLRWFYDSHFPLNISKQNISLFVNILFDLKFSFSGSTKSCHLETENFIRHQFCFEVQQKLISQKFKHWKTHRDNWY